MDERTTDTHRTNAPRGALRRRAATAFLSTAALASVALTTPACVTTTEPKEVKAPAAERSGPSPEETAAASEGPGVGDYVMVVPENVVYLPWKLVGGGVKGASDGVQAGFDEGRMPLFGALFSPINLVVGFVTGMFEGVALSPGLVGPSDNFGRAMSGPTKNQTSIWWYPK